MKINYLFIYFFCLSFIYSQTISLSDINFKVEKYSDFKSLEKFVNANNKIYNTALSSILPVNAIYKLDVQENGKSAIIQIGYSQIQTSPEQLFVSDDFYNFVTDNGQNKTPTIRLTFLAWTNVSDNEYLDIKSLVITPENSIDKIASLSNKYYIQLGSFSFYQNSYPKISELLPYLEIKPNFFMIEYNDPKINNKLYRVLAGPYSKEDALNISKKINRYTKEPVFIKSSETILNERKKN